MQAFCKKPRHAAFVALFYLAICLSAHAQSNSATINGTVLDPTGAVVPNATVEIHNPVSHFDESATTDGAGRFTFTNVPFNPYHMSVKGPGFAPYAQDIDARSVVPLEVKINLTVAGSAESVTVEAGADFLSVIGAIWNYPDGPKAAVAAFNTVFARYGRAYPG